MSKRKKPTSDNAEPKKRPRKLHDMRVRFTFEGEQLAEFCRLVLGLNVLKATERKKNFIKMPKEITTDLLAEVTLSPQKEGDEPETKFVHTEVQVRQDPEMLGRMLEYDAAFVRKLGRPALQYLLWLGEGPWKAPTELISDDLKFRYHVISLSEMDADVLLSSNNMETVAFAVLCHNKQPKRLPLRIIHRLEELAPHPETFGDALALLAYLSTLRRLEAEVLELSRSALMEFIIKGEDYRQAMEKFIRLIAEREYAEGKAQREAELAERHAQREAELAERHAHEMEQLQAEVAERLEQEVLRVQAEEAQRREQLETQMNAKQQEAAQAHSMLRQIALNLQKEGKTVEQIAGVMQMSVEQTEEMLRLD